MCVAYQVVTMVLPIEPQEILPAQNNDSIAMSENLPNLKIIVRTGH